MDRHVAECGSCSPWYRHSLSISRGVAFKDIFQRSSCQSFNTGDTTPLVGHFQLLLLSPCLPTIQTKTPGWLPTLRSHLVPQKMLFASWMGLHLFPMPGGIVLASILPIVVFTRQRSRVPHIPDHKGTSVLLKTPLTLFEVRGKHFWEVVHTFGRWYIAPTDTPLKGKLPHLLFLSNPLFL